MSRYKTTGEGGEEHLVFEENNIMLYIDDYIHRMRKKKAQGDETAKYYIDALQSVRTSIFGSTLPATETRDTEVSL